MMKILKNQKNMVFYCHSNPNIIFIVQTIGGTDLEFGVEVPNKEALDFLLEEMRNKFEDIRAIDYSSMGGYEKYTYFFK